MPVATQFRRRRRGLVTRAALVAALGVAVAACEGPTDTPGRHAGVPPGDPGARAIAAGLAAQCGGCHGADGESARPSVPNLAGQQPAFIYSQLRAFQVGERPGEAMAQVAAVLGDPGMFEVAGYYGARRPGAGRAPDGAQRCAACHGADGNGVLPGIPDLAGRDARVLADALFQYRDSERREETMETLLRGWSDGDIEKVARFFALQARRPSAGATGDTAPGQALAAATCADCHGEDGNSPEPDTPSLAGQDAEYLAGAARAYMQGRRRHDLMRFALAGLQDQEIDDLAAFYAAARLRGAEPERYEATLRRRQVCDGCHGAGGRSTDPGVPVLAGQREAYLLAALHAFQIGSRAGDVMQAQGARIGARELRDLAAYYAAQPPGHRAPDEAAD